LAAESATGLKIDLQGKRENLDFLLNVPIFNLETEE
jgi:hypothetical protein